MKPLAIFLSIFLVASASASEPNVKKSESGICHDKKSPSYAQTKKFVPFENVEECLKSDGRSPATTKEKEPADPVKKSESGICHDKSSANYSSTNKFTPYRTMEECLKSGGKPVKK